MSRIGVSPSTILQDTGAPQVDAPRQTPDTTSPPRVQVDSQQKARAAQKDIAKGLKLDRGIGKLSTKDVLTPTGMESILGRASKSANHKDAMMRVVYALENRCKPDAAFGSNHKAVIRLAGEYEALKNSGADAGQLRPLLQQMKDKVEDMHYKQDIRHLFLGRFATPAGTHRLELAKFIQHEIDSLAPSPGPGPTEQPTSTTVTPAPHSPLLPPTDPEPSPGAGPGRETDLGSDVTKPSVRHRASDLAKSGVKFIDQVLSKPGEFAALLDKLGTKVIDRIFSPFDKLAELDSIISARIRTARQGITAEIRTAAQDLGAAMAKEIREAGDEARTAILDHFEAESFKELIYAKLSLQPGADPALFGTSLKDAAKEVKDFVATTYNAVRSHLSS